MYLMYIVYPSMYTQSAVKQMDDANRREQRRLHFWALLSRTVAFFQCHISISDADRIRA